MTVLATDDSWRLVTLDGTLIPLRVAVGADIQVGKPKRELVQAPFSSLVSLADGDGQWQANEIPIEFIARGVNARDKFGARAEERVLKEALTSAVGIYGARSYEGLYLPLLAALKDGEPMEGEPGQRVLPYNLIPATVQENTLEHGWLYPLLDAADATQDVTVANESRPDAPVLTFRSSSRWSAPVPFSKMSQGTFIVGHLFSGVGSYNLMSLGLPTEGAFAQSLTFDTGSFFARVGTTGSITVLASSVGGLGYPIFWAMTFVENGLLRLYSFSRLGFQDHGTAAVGVIQPLATKRLYLGSTPLSSLTGQMFPGAPRFAAPAFTHRVLEADEIKEALGRTYAHHVGVTFTEPELIPGLTLTVSQSFTEVVAGQSAPFSLTATKTGGYTGELEVLFDSDDSGVRPAATPQEDEEDAETGVVVYDGVLTVEEGTPVREYTVGVTVRAVGWTENGPLKTVKATGQLVFEVEATPAAPDADAKSIHTIYSPQAYDLNTLKRDSVGTGLYPLNLFGLAHYSTRGDGLYLNATNVTPYGKTYATVDDAISMADSHGRYVFLWNAASTTVGTVFASFASKTVKGDYWYIYKGQSGIQVKLAGGGGSNLTDTPNLPAVDGLMHVAVRYDKTTNKLYLTNAKTKAEVFTDGRNWSGNGLFTAFAMKQSDSTVSLVSRGTLLGQAGYGSLPTVAQLERHAAYMETFTLRNPSWARDEWPDGTDYIFEMVGGEIYRNRHPATATAVPTLTAVASPTTTGDSVKTNGTSQLVHTPVLNRGIQVANDAVFAMRDFRTGGNAANKVQIGMTAQNSSAIYFRAHMSPNANNKRALSSVAPGAFTLVQSDAVVPTGDRAFSLRYASGKVTFEDIATGELVVGELTDGSVISGNLVYSLGGTKRQDSTTIATFFGVSECKGFILCARALNPTEKQSAAANLQNVFDYSSAPVGGTGGGTTPAPTISAFTASPTAINSGSSATLAYTISGTYTALSISGVGSVTASSGSGSVSVSPTTTTTYTLTASNGSASSTAQVTVVVNGTGGGTSSGVTLANFGPDLTGTYNKDALYPSTSQARTYLNIIDRALPRDEKDFTVGGYLEFPRAWKGTTADADANYAGTKSGAYYSERMDGVGLDNMCLFARITRDPAWMPKIYDSADRNLGIQDYRGTPDSKAYYKDYSPARTKTLGAIYGYAAAGTQSRNSMGGRQWLEPGCGITGKLQAAWMLFVNRSLNANYAPMSHKLRCLYVKHLQVQWREHHIARGKWYDTDGVTRKWAEYVKRTFTHADSSEWSGSMYWALLETAIYNSGLLSPVSVVMPGKDFSETQYVGTMIDASYTETSFALHPTTSSNVTTHQGWIDAKAGFLNWINSRSVQLMAATTFKDTAMRTRFPDGAYVWTTGNAGAGATSNFFAAPTTYDNETIGHLIGLYIHGVITEALGSQANADLAMRRFAAYKAVGSYADAPTVGKARRSGLGYLNATVAPDGVAGHVFNTSVPNVSNSYDTYHADRNSTLRDLTLGLACWDSAGYLDTVYPKFVTELGSSATNGTLVGGAASMLMKHISLYGRGS